VSDATRPFSTSRIGDIAPAPAEGRWLVRSLWPQGAVGILGGPPKSCKTWLGLDLALSVASATPCLGTFPVQHPGPVLAYLAEDSLDRVRERIDGMARHRGVDLHALELHLITEPTLRLDNLSHIDRLYVTVKAHRPRLLLLDPLVRLHNLNENDAGEVSAILALLRSLQRTYGVAVALVHHARKNGRTTTGEALRGSGELYAWGDTYGYLQRAQDALRLRLEHRHERPIEPILLRLVSRPDGSCPHLEIAQPTEPPEPTGLHDSIVVALAAGEGALTRGALRSRLKINNNRLGLALSDLEQRGTISRTSQGWVLRTPAYRSAP
jgi:hypothetical protein